MFGLPYWHGERAVTWSHSLPIFAPKYAIHHTTPSLCMLAAGAVSAGPVDNQHTISHLWPIRLPELVSILHGNGFQVKTKL